MTRIIELTPHDSNWADSAMDEARAISKALASNVLAVHHIGSTAIPGILAKPTLDLLVEVWELQAVDQANPAMIALGYEPHGEYGMPGRRYFVKKKGEKHTHHVHVFQKGNPEIERHLNFRDYLISHPEEARAYAELKERLAQDFRTDPEGYTEAKSDFIKRVDEKAMQFYGDRSRRA